MQTKKMQSDSSKRHITLFSYYRMGRIKNSEERIKVSRIILNAIYSNNLKMDELKFAVSNNSNMIKLKKKILYVRMNECGIRNSYNSI